MGAVDGGGDGPPALQRAIEGDAAADAAAAGHHDVDAGGRHRDAARVAALPLHHQRPRELPVDEVAAGEVVPAAVAADEPVPHAVEVERGGGVGLVHQP